MEGGDYVFYGDIYLLQSVFLKITVIYLSLLTRRYARRITLWVVGGISGAGAFAEILLLLLMPGSFGLVWFLWVIEYPLFFLVLTGKKGNRKQVISLSMWSVVYVILLNGVVQAIEVRWEGNYTIILLLASTALGAITRQVLLRRKMLKGIYPFLMIHKGKTVMGEALYDSGNGLRDPYTGKGVMVAGSDFMKRILQFEDASVYIPYHSIGKPCGMLKAYYVDSMIIYKEKEEIYFSKVPVAIAEEGVQSKEYQLILNQDVW